MIDHQHKALLKQVLQTKLQAASNPSVTSSYPMLKIFRWSLLPGLVAAGVAVWTVLLPAQSSLSFLDHVQVVLAAEVAQADNTVHHQIITITDTTQPELVVTQEQWDSPTQHVTKYFEAGGQLTDALAQIGDKNYELHPNTVALSDADDIVCILNFSDEQLPVASAIQAKQSADGLINTSATADRQTVIEELLQNSAVVDLGVRDGLHQFSITQADSGDATIYNYSFDPTTFGLVEYSYHFKYLIDTPQQFEEYAYTYHYTVNEYVTPESISASVWDTASLTEVDNQLDDKPTGCYTSTGEKVSEISYTTPVGDNGLPTILFDQSLPENQYLNNVVIDNTNKAADGIGITFINPNLSEGAEEDTITIKN